MAMNRREIIALATGLAVSTLAAGRACARTNAAAGDGVTDDSDALIDLFNRMKQTGRADLSSGTYRVNKPLIIPPGVLTGGDVVLDFREAKRAEFPDGTCLLVQGKDKTPLPRLARDLAIGGRKFVFAKPHGLSSGDTFQLSGTVDYAGNGYRAYYRKGEMFVVGRVVNANTVETRAGCRDTYELADVTCWKRADSSFEQKCASLRVIAPDDVDYPLRFVTLDHSTVSNIRAEGGAVSAIDFIDCHDFSGENIHARQRSKIFDGYGISICHCQWFNLSGEAYGYFNGITTGGGPHGPEGRVGINRDIHFQGKGGSDPIGGLAGVHFHGNTEYSSYRGIFLNGATLCGNNNEAHGHFIGRNGQFAIHFGEMHGHSFHISGVVRTTGPDLPKNMGAIDMDDFGLHARYGGRTIIDVELHAAQASRIILWRTQNLLQKDVTLEFRRFDVVEAHPEERVIVLSKVSGKVLPLIEFGKWNIVDDRVPLIWSVDPGTRLRGLLASKTVAVAARNAAHATAPIAFDAAFPRTPKFTSIIEGRQLASTAPLIANIVDSSENGGVVVLSTADRSKRDIDVRVTVSGFFDD